MAFDIPICSHHGALLACLRGTAISVPLRTESRDQRTHVEPYIISHLIAALAIANKLAYPLSCKQREKPDFELVLGDCSVGVEVSEVVENGYAHYATVAEKIGVEGEVLESGHFRDGRVHTRKEVEALLGPDHLPPRPFYGEEPEQEWASHMAHRISVKQRKLTQYERFRANWLALYDNLHFPDVDLQTAVDFLRVLMPQCSAHLTFDAIFIESGRFIIRLTHDQSEWIEKRPIFVTESS